MPLEREKLYFISTADNKHTDVLDTGRKWPLKKEKCGLGSKLYILNPIGKALTHIRTLSVLRKGQSCLLGLPITNQARGLSWNVQTPSSSILQRVGNAHA